MPRPTSNGPNVRPDGYPIPPIEYDDTSGWFGSYTAFRYALFCGGIDPLDIDNGIYPVRLRDILAFRE